MLPADHDATGEPVFEEVAVERGGNLAVKLFLEDVPREALERLLDSARPPETAKPR